MRDRTAQTEPLTIGQQIVARWEGLASGWTEPADLAEAIDEAIAAERERCASIAAMGTPDDDWHPQSHFGVVGKKIADLIRNQ